MRNKILLTCVLASVAVMSGCARMHIHPEQGEAVSSNIETQTLNPGAGSEPVEHTLTGQKAQHVINAYHSQKASTSKEKLVDNIGD